MRIGPPRLARPGLMMIALTTSFAIGGAASAALQGAVVTNHDPFAHNVFSQTPGMSFDLRTQKPGHSSEVQFDNVGVADVQCAIHPQMRMRVRVIPQ